MNNFCFTETKCIDLKWKYKTLTQLDSYNFNLQFIKMFGLDYNFYSKSEESMHRN